MGKFDGVLLASDFDNTILNTERPRRTGCPIPPISQRNVEALRYFMDNGGRFAVATGRALPAFRMFAEQVPMNAPAVVCNGGALYDFKIQNGTLSGNHGAAGDHSQPRSGCAEPVSHSGSGGLSHGQCDPCCAAQRVHPAA